MRRRCFDPYDDWLDSIGLIRKQVPHDGSCLFRAVAEQVFLTQNAHHRLRELCLEYMLWKREEFEPFLDIPLDHHVFTMRDAREWGGHLEIIAMSRLFNVNFLIYQDIGKPPYNLTRNDQEKTLMLSYTHGNHYDILYKKEHSSSRGFCQSVVYDILYSHVFKLDDVGLAVDTMLHDKEYASFRRDSNNSAELKEIGAIVEKILGTSISKDSQDEADKNQEKNSLEDIPDDDVKGLLSHGIPPFPYKVAKSLDPDLYRNIELDTWNAMRREARYGPYDFNGFQAGVKVIIKLDNIPERQVIEDMRRTHSEISGNEESGEGKLTEVKPNIYHGHIQEMSENKGPVDVYVEEIGCRWKVPYESLERVPPSSPHSSAQQHSTGGVPVNSPLPNYKKLSGFYQKATIPAEDEFSGGKRKGKNKQMKDASLVSNNTHSKHYTLFNREMSLGNPTPASSSPRLRNTWSSTKAMSQGSENQNTQNDFPSFPNNTNFPVALEGAWAARANTDHSMVSSTPKACNNSHSVSNPQPSMNVAAVSSNTCITSSSVSMTPPPPIDYMYRSGNESDQDPYSAAVPMSHTMPPYYVSPVPMMCCGYNSPYPFMPMMFTPNTDVNSPQFPGGEFCQPYLPVSFGPAFYGDSCPSSMLPPPPPPPPAFNPGIPPPYDCTPKFHEQGKPLQYAYQNHNTPDDGLWLQGNAGMPRTKRSDGLSFPSGRRKGNHPKQQHCNDGSSSISPPAHYATNDRLPGIYPLNLHDGSPYSQVCPAPPGYITGAPWMWMMKEF